MMKPIIALLIPVLFLEIAICRGTSYPQVIEVLIPLEDLELPRQQNPDVFE